MTVGGIVFFVVLTIVLFVAFYCCLNEGDFGWMEWWMHLCLSPLVLLMSLLINVVVFLFMVCIAYGVDESTPLPETKKEIPIYSIGVNTQYSVFGGFTLGCGTIEGTSIPSYRFYEMTEDGKYHLEEIPAENFDIVCTDFVTPKIVIDATYEGMKRKRLGWMFEKDMLKIEIEKKNLHGTIYIPEGSVIQSYEIKL